MKKRKPVRFIKVPCIQLGTSPPEDHPGWNIVDEIEMGPQSECCYVVDLVRGQAASISSTSGQRVALIVKDEDEHEVAAPDSCHRASGSLHDSGTILVTFRVARTAAYDVIVVNLDDRAAHILVRITVPPARRMTRQGNVAS